MALSTYGICRKISREHAQKVPGLYPEQRQLDSLLGECALVLYAHCCAKKWKWGFLQNFPSKRVPFVVKQTVFSRTLSTKHSKVYRSDTLWIIDLHFVIPQLIFLITFSSKCILWNSFVKSPAMWKISFFCNEIHYFDHISFAFLFKIKLLRKSWIKHNNLLLIVTHGVISMLFCF